MVGAATIRRAGPDDVPLIRGLVHESYAKWLDVIGHAPRPMLADYNRAVVEHDIDLLVVDQSVVALIETTPVADGLLVVNVAVTPGAQKRGHGRVLLAHAERVAGALGLGRMRLYTNKLMEPNITLYRQLGYEIEREEAAAAVGTVVHMTKTL